LLKEYIKVDPVVNEGKLRALPFDWSELTPDESAIELFTEFQAQGNSPHGFTIPILDKVGRRGLLSLNASPERDDWDAVVNDHKEDWIELGQVLHKRAIYELFGDNDPAPTLSPRELETLYWTAMGKDYKDIAAILDISDYTIRTYMRALRNKLDCSTLSQAVAKAVKLKLIDPS
jgi:DNA-binding CsgD family transcriptional regulator